ncbi:DOC family protein [Colletotrichum musicola]|uniref:DOC family protein n=1 Tax=Colletotrichum musicola TaxID=2175873 RepID=A0A8H6MY84_9PEZI|nr:DOC family protein [Colletotrichum musicola]
MSSSKGIRFLTANQIVASYAAHVSRASWPTQPALLRSAADAPANINHYLNETDVFALAGILSERIILNHAFSDGNKRTAFLAADLFLKMNGFRMNTGEGVDEGLRDGLVEAAAGGSWGVGGVVSDACGCWARNGGLLYGF